MNRFSAKAQVGIAQSIRIPLCLIILTTSACAINNRAIEGLDSRSSSAETTLSNTQTTTRSTAQSNTRHPKPSTSHSSTHYENRTQYRAPKAQHPLRIDGVADEKEWQLASWQPLNQRWLGPEYSSDDFSGRYKVLWTEDRLYLLAELTDDVLFDSHRNPLEHYWDDDCLEIFLDEDFSGGNHQYNHNAFAYHVSLDNRTIDVGTDKKPREYSHHIESRWQQHGDKLIWELAIAVYPDQYQDHAKNTPITLTAEKTMGFMVAYCDNDGSEQRENFIGSEYAPGEDKNRGWIDAGLFGKLILVE